MHLVNSQNAFDRLFHTNDSIFGEINNVGVYQLPNLKEPLASCLNLMDYTESELEYYGKLLKKIGEIIVELRYNELIPLFNHYDALIKTLKNQSTPQWG